jgi:LuxR family maltose regulon positive regulatory protein
VSTSRTRSARTSTGEAQAARIDPKLRPSLLPSPTVRRTALVNRLRASAAPTLAVVAPAGYGKTTLLAQWIARDGRPAAWLNAEAEDDGEAALLASVTAATGDLPADGEPLIFVIDDAHLLRSSGARRVLSALLDRLPPGSTLAFAGRGEPCVPIARLRARGHVFELGTAELAMSGNEGRALLAAAGAAVDDDDAAELVRATEGWPVGLHLAAAELERLGSRQSSAPTTGIDRFVVDYLRLEVLSDLPEDRLVFLVRASALETMCGSLCDSVLERSGSAALLEQLEQAQLFLVPLDRSRTWYRFHPQFRAALRSELERREPGGSSKLGARAAAWFEANGQLEAAVDQARAAGDTERVARLVDTLGAPALLRGQRDTVLRWLDGVGDRNARVRAVAGLGAWVHALAGSQLEALRWEDSMPPGSTIPRPSCESVEQLRSGAEQAAAALPADSVWQTMASTLLGTALLLEGENEHADATLARAVERSEVVGAPAFASLGLAERALLALARGEQAAAGAQVDRAVEIVNRAGLARYVTSSLVFALAARVALRRGAPTRARDALARADACTATRAQPLPWLTVQTRLELARAYIGLADAARAAGSLDAAEAVLAELPGLRALGAEVGALRRLLDAVPTTTTGLTRAELRLVPLLATHLSFREIAERLVLSRNTVKTQAISVYRKLGVSSRSEAIARADELGLVQARGSSPPPAP